LSENAGFAQAVVDAGLIFIGPSPDAIRAMGSKIEAKQRAVAAGVPIVPGYNGEDQSDEVLIREGLRVGFPLLVKASAGGGGKGMRAVYSADDLLSSLHAARREAQAAFGDGALMIERYIQRPRHVEIQVLGDQHGNVVHLFERECSIQRRHQKIIEEAPSPALTPDMRAQMGAAAVALTKSIGYTSAGTVEFILAPSGEFYFLEVNTRLQVEHPVTECITGLDLVREQLLIAQGEALSFDTSTMTPKGAAVECRLYAEDPANQFLPCIGPVLDFDWPAREGLRIDSGVEAGNAVGIYYDPMLAKIVTWGRDRAEAVRRMIAALRAASVLGTQTNQDFLIRLLEHPAFAAGDLHTHFIDQHFPPEDRAPKPSAEAIQHALIAAAVARITDRIQRRQQSPNPVLPQVAPGFRNNVFRPQEIQFELAGETHTVHYQHISNNNQISIQINGSRTLTVQAVSWNAPALRLDIDGLRFTARVVFENEHRLHIHTLSAALTLTEHPRLPSRLAAVDPGACTAPMPGKISKILVIVGQQVSEGDPLAILEAMKMEHTVRAPVAGTITALHVSPGDQVEAEATLVNLNQAPHPPTPSPAKL
jgi:acetyl/propionyl-CoA carboxylase alpha subunit